MAIGIMAAGVLAMPAAAAAEDRYAAPGGTGSEPCAPAAPCSIDAAVEGAGAGPGDVVKVLAGTHNPAPESGSPTSALVITQPLTIEPADPATRPTIAAGDLTTVISFAAGATIRGLEITAVNPASSALDLQQQTVAERLLVRVSGSSPTAASVRNGSTLRDSVAWAPASGLAVQTGGTGASLDNVTAVGGFRGIAIDSNFGANQGVGVTNTVAAGGSPGDDLFIREATGTSVSVTLDHSNYDDLANSGAAVAETAPQSAPPVFLLPGLGNFHQLEGSPTVNAGAIQPSTGSRLDLDGELRWLGTAPDIGADEFTEAPPPAPPGAGPPAGAAPETTLTRQSKRKRRTQRKRVRVRAGFISSVPAATFECSLDKRPFAACSSPWAAKVKRGRHRLRVRAVDAAGNVDPTPAQARWNVRRKRS